MHNIEAIRKKLTDNYRSGKTRNIGGSECVEIQNANFIADEPYILRPVNADYAKREVEWYESQSLYVDDIPGETPKIWKAVADKNGKINSNYGWCIFSEENGSQYNNCIAALLRDQHSRQACMIYNRPSMHEDATANGMHDFMCTFCVQCFLNEIYDADNNMSYVLKYIVTQRSCDAVFGFNNDNYWHCYVIHKMCRDLTEKLGVPVIEQLPEFNIGSLHVYERHFKYLED